MHPLAGRTEPTAIRRVFAAWSIEIPMSFDRTFVHEDGYWHAYDAHRSVSLTSVTVTDEGGPVRAEVIARQIPPSEGTPVVERPAGLLGWATIADAPQPARASRMLAGVLAADGRLLVVTITSDDLDWARRTWLSISGHPGQPLGGERSREKERRLTH